MGVATSKPEDSSLLALYQQTRDVELRNRLLEQYLYIARIVARRFSGRGIEFDDLFQVGSLALLKALERYDAARGVSFASFATPTVVGEVKNYFRDKLRPVRLPRKSQLAIGEVERARGELSQTLMRTPYLEEISAHLKMPLETVLEAVEAQAAGYTTSLDRVVSEEGDSPLGEFLGYEDSAFDRLEFRDYIRRVLETLPKTEQHILRERFVNERSQRDIANDLQVSQMYVSRVERRALDTFRKIWSAG